MLQSSGPFDPAVTHFIIERACPTELPNYLSLTKEKLPIRLFRIPLTQDAAGR